ncbi:hypothetical protein B0H14DRAFT_1351879 [Mycena olivaceomarginata]|nr:hypothetical protein B0H14DRAFT_1351879 [Mycena olivaceomarginata]
MREGAAHGVSSAGVAGPALGNRGRAAHGVQSAGVAGPTLGGLHALVVGLETRMAAQEDKIAVQENKIAALEQEIRRLKGPRFPPEIFSLIVESAREDKKALETFSLVCFRWMYITRKILFARIPLDLRQVILWGNKRQLSPLLDNPRCTLFPHVRALTIRMEYGHGNTRWRRRKAKMTMTTKSQ